MFTSHSLILTCRLCYHLQPVILACSRPSTAPSVLREGGCISTKAGTNVLEIPAISQRDGKEHHAQGRLHMPRAEVYEQKNKNKNKKTNHKKPQNLKATYLSLVSILGAIQNIHIYVYTYNMVLGDQLWVTLIKQGNWNR